VTSTEPAFDRGGMLGPSHNHRLATVLLALALMFLCDVSAQTSRVFRDQAHGFSFRYPEDWEPVEPQRSATRVLLYARDGSEATANVSVVKSDRNNVRGFNTEYFESTLQKTYHQSRVLNVRYISVLGKDMAIAEASFRAETPSFSLDGKSLAMATIHNGKRYMLVVNGLPHDFEKPAAAFNVMVSTFSFH